MREHKKKKNYKHIIYLEYIHSFKPTEQVIFLNNLQRLENGNRFCNNMIIILPKLF